jgi:lysophospholipase L1-like esterase
VAKLAKTITLIAVNVAVFSVLVGCIEIYFRLWVNESVSNVPNGLWQTFEPYVMVTTAPGEYRQFANEFTRKTYPSTVKTNSLGFNDRREFSLTSEYKRESNEKLVLFTGGSAAWGVGATATDRTVAARLEHYLNESQKTYKYSVVNLAMGSWIGFQEFIGLQLWGREFGHPDWVIVMDGFNDAGVGCGFSQGPGNPLYFATMRSYIHGYLLSTRHPVFYRGWLENELIKYSKAYRVITDRQYVPNDQVFDQTSGEKNPIRRQVIPTKLGQSREILQFYLEAEKAILKLYPDAHYILSTQPIVNQFAGDFVDIYKFPIGSPERKAAIDKRTVDLERYLTQYENAPCGEKNAQPSFTYIFGNGAVQLEQIADARRAAGRAVDYYNVGTLFPDAREDRMPFFIDPVHLSDLGMDLIGKYYAEKILAADVRSQAPAYP